MQLLEILIAFIICHNLQKAILQTKSKNPITLNMQLKACFDLEEKLKNYSNNYIVNFQ